MKTITPCLLALALLIPSALAQDEAPPPSPPPAPAPPAGALPARPAQPALPPAPPAPPDIAASLDHVRADVDAQLQRVHEDFARAEADFALAISSDGEGVVHGGGFSFINPPATQPPLVASGNRLGDDKQDELTEDLQIMSRILQKSLDRQSKRRDPGGFAMGIPVFSYQNSQRLQTFYLEDYGALFILDVPLALAPGPAADSPAPETNEPSNDWEQTRQELKGPRTPAGFPGWKAREVKTATYNPEQIQALQRDLIDSLKNAANIRALKRDDSVTVVLRGTRGGSPDRVGTATAAVAGSSSKSGTQSRNTSQPPNQPQPRQPHPAVQPGVRQRLADVVWRPDDGTARATLTLRARKADIDAFAKGSLSVEQFTGKVQTRVD